MSSNVERKTCPCCHGAGKVETDLDDEAYENLPKDTDKLMVECEVCHGEGSVLC